MNPHITNNYWMNIAKEVANASTCRVKVGCVLVLNKQIVGMGFVESVHGDYHCIDVGCNLVSSPHRGSSDTGESCIRTIHAEVNAVLKCTARGTGTFGWIECYSTHYPCLDCLKALLQIGVRNIFYLKQYKDEWREQFLKKYTGGCALNISQLEG